MSAVAGVSPRSPADIVDDPNWYRLDELPTPVIIERGAWPAALIGPNGLYVSSVPTVITWTREIRSVSTLEAPTRYRVRYRLDPKLTNRWLTAERLAQRRRTP